MKNTQIFKEFRGFMLFFEVSDVTHHSVTLSTCCFKYLSSSLHSEDKGLTFKFFFISVSMLLERWMWDVMIMQCRTSIISSI